jgi:maltose O-acetyltransferase
MNRITGVEDGELYDANYDSRILALRNRAKNSCYDYNATRPGDEAERRRLLKELLGSCGDGIVIEPPFWCDYGVNIHIGTDFYANHGLVILDGARVSIGNHVFIAPNVGIHTAGHPLDAERRNAGQEYALPVTIGDNVWIGAGVTLVPGVCVGNNSVIGAGSVVTRDIPPDVVAVGNPCRVIREITVEDAARTRF